ncbi:MAG: TonB-dependent receptor, partial [Flavobacteriaceae bacterium]
MKFLVDMQRILWVFFLLFTLGFHAQEITVLDADDQAGIPNVALFNEDRSKTVITDFDGRCDITDFDRNEKIYLRHLNYQLRRSTKAQMLRQG